MRRYSLQTDAASAFRHDAGVDENPAELRGESPCGTTTHQKVPMRKAVLIAFSFATSFVVGGSAFAAEGMWTLDNLPKARMQAEYGFSPDAAWVDRAMRASVRLAGGCSGSFVSPDGLVLTNHHCAVSCVEQLSTKTNDMVAAGFLATTRDKEVRCPEIELNRLEKITDVTADVKSATKGLDGEPYKLAMNATRARLTQACVGDEKATTRCDMVDLYHGGVYQIYKYHRFSDARLVFAPEAAIAFFGGDPDNFNFPRYDLDMAMLRAYENDKPAVVKDYFPFSKNGAAPGELTIVTGHPGSTQRQLTVAQLETLRDVRLLHGLLGLAQYRGLLTQFSSESPESERVAHTQLFGVENSYKVLKGEIEALQSSSFMASKRAEEDALKAFAAAHPELPAAKANPWAAIEKAQAQFRDIEGEYESIELTRSYLTRYVGLARILVRGSEEMAKPNGQRLPEFSEARRPEIEQALFSSAPIYPAFEKVKLTYALTRLRERLGPDHPFVKQLLGKESPEQFADRAIKSTTLADVAARRTLWVGGKDAIAKSDDPFIKMVVAIDPAARAIRKRYENEVESVEAKNAELIAQTRFAQLGTSVYPDATFTLRLSYGEVKGWMNQGKMVPPYTVMSGAFDRNTGADPFALPASWLASKEKLTPTQPFNFVTDNDIIGGNSGSPMINRNGALVGLVFDGNINSLGGAYGFDAPVNRTVAVHSGAILEALRKIYHADALVTEMTGR